MLAIIKYENKFIAEKSLDQNDMKNRTRVCALAGVLPDIQSIELGKGIYPPVVRGLRRQPEIHVNLLSLLIHLFALLGAPVHPIPLPLFH